MKGSSGRRRRWRRAETLLLTLVVVLLSGACASVQSTTGQPAAATSTSTPGAATTSYAEQALYRPINGACRAILRPDRAVIVGGMSASGIKPTETAARLDRQLDVLKALADEENATLRLVERVRAARSPRSRSRDQAVEPYVVVQRIELETGLDADIDRLLERTLQTGLDRYGSSAGVEPQSGGSQPLVVYRFSDLDGLLRSAHDQCRSSAIRTWCETQAGDDTGACVAALEAPEMRLTTEQFVLTSRPVTKANGNVEAVQVLWPWVATVPLELGGDAELHFSGTITLRSVEGFR